MTRLQGVFSIERVVMLLSPVLAAAAAAIVGWAGSHVGIKLDPGSVEGIEIAAIVGTFGVVAKWLHGRQIPAIAGLRLPLAAIDELHKEIEAYLAAHAGTTAADEEKLVKAVLGRIAGAAISGEPPPAGPQPQAPGSVPQS